MEKFEIGGVYFKYDRTIGYSKTRVAIITGRTDKTINYVSGEYEHGALKINYTLKSDRRKLRVDKRERAFDGVVDYEFFEDEFFTVIHAYDCVASCYGFCDEISKRLAWVRKEGRAKGVNKPLAVRIF